MRKYEWIIGTSAALLLMMGCVAGLMTAGVGSRKVNAIGETAGVYLDCGAGYGGDDSNDGLSATSPVRTLARALDIMDADYGDAVAPDTVYVMSEITVSTDLSSDTTGMEDVTYDTASEVSMTRDGLDLDGDDGHAGAYRLIDLGGRKLVRYPGSASMRGYTGYLIHVEDGASLVLENTMIDVKGTSVATLGSLIRADEDAALFIDEGVVVRNDIITNSE